MEQGRYRLEHHKLWLVPLAVCYLVALFVFSCYTSPLFPNNYGYDSAIFSLVGKGLTEGKGLYTELFDHKGPVIFWINALGYLLGGQTGIFIIQYLFGLISMVFLFLTGMVLRRDRSSFSFAECFGIFFAVYAFFFYSFQRGNLTEEYALPFISASLYLFVKYAVGSEYEVNHPPRYAFFHGINFAVLAFLRLNNAVTICMGILTIAVYLGCRQRYKNLLVNLAAGIGGILLVVVPILVYFFRQGALEEMLYATFLHNFKIAGNTSRISLTEEPVKFAALYFPMLVCAVLMVVNCKEKGAVRFPDILLFLILCANAGSLWIANRFPHYFAVFAPVYAVFLLRYFSFDSRKVLRILVILCTLVNLAFASYFSLSSFNDVYIQKSVILRNDAVRNAAEVIADHERDSVIGYRIQASDYLAADLTPCYKYYTLQDTWSITSPHIMEEYMTWMKEEKPVWVILQSDETDEMITDILEKEYVLNHKNEYLLFYRIMDNNDKVIQ